MKSILVTGGAGRLGRHVLDILDGRGVAGVRRPGNGAGHVELLVTEPSILKPSRLAGFDAIINCAGMVTGAPNELDLANLSYPVSLAECALEAGVPRFIQVSSFAVYGRVERIDHHSMLAPDGVYGRSKLKAERALEMLGTPTFCVTPVRLPFMFSEREPALLGRLVQAMLLLRVLPVPRDGTSKRSMITYQQAARTLVTLATAPQLPAGPVVVADPEALDLASVARSVRALLNRRIAIVPVPAILAALVRPMAPTALDRLMRSSVLDPSANWLKGEADYPVAIELAAYLDRMKECQ